MKITNIKPILCDGGWTPYIFVKVETDEGISGYGECTERHSAGAIVGCVNDLEPILKGKDPRTVEKLYFEMYRHLQNGPGGIAQRAIAGIEIALWDIKAKALGIPLYELFGGPIRESIRVYWSHCATYRAREQNRAIMGTPPVRSYDDIAKIGEEVVRRGYNAFKTNMVIPGNPSQVYSCYDQNFSRELLKAVDKLLDTFRKSVGDDVDIMLDLNFNFKTEGYIEVAKVVEPYRLMWLEVDIYDPRALRQIKDSVNVPICSAECLYTIQGYRPYLENRAMDICMIDLPWNGYIESRKIAALAEAFQIMVAPHNYYSHLATFINAHLCAVIPNLKICETDVDSAPWRDDIVTEMPNIKNSYLHLPIKPGIGVELNEKEIAKHPWPK